MAGGHRRFTRDAARAVDREAIADWGMPGAILMENAAAAIEAAVLEELSVLAAGDGPLGPVLVACGTGNNGGDGWAVARRLRNRRDDGEQLPEVQVVAWSDQRPGYDAAVQAAITRRMGVPVLGLEAAGAAAGPRPAVVVDAVLGTGLERAVAGEAGTLLELIDRWRAAGSRVVAVDVPSGLDADTGRPAGGAAAVRADVTVSLMGPKAGFADAASAQWTGRVLVGDIGVPRAILDRHATA